MPGQHRAHLLQVAGRYRMARQLRTVRRLRCQQPALAAQFGARSFQNARCSRIMQVQMPDACALGLTAIDRCTLPPGCVASCVTARRKSPPVRLTRWTPARTVAFASPASPVRCDHAQEERHGPGRAPGRQRCQLVHRPPYPRGTRRRAGVPRPLAQPDLCRTGRGHAPLRRPPCAGRHRAGAADRPAAARTRWISPSPSGARCAPAWCRCRSTRC